MPDRMIDKILKIWIMVVLSIMLLPFDGLAQDNLDVTVKQARRVVYGGEVAFKSRYIWHGFPLEPGGSHATLCLGYGFKLHIHGLLQFRP